MSNSSVLQFIDTSNLQGLHASMFYTMLFGCVSVLWHYVCEHLTKHEYERYLLLKQVCTDVGRGRAWLRSSLNEHSLERYLHCMLGSTTHLSIFFEDWAFLLDQEKSSMLPTMAAGMWPQVWKGMLQHCLCICEISFSLVPHWLSGNMTPLLMDINVMLIS